jgi:hypothetical protein
LKYALPAKVELSFCGQWAKMSLRLTGWKAVLTQT